MSSFMYPNSATRKLYGQAGRALQRQNKRFANQQARDSENYLKQLSAREKSVYESAQAKFRAIQKKERIVIAVIFFASIIGLTLYEILK